MMDMDKDEKQMMRELYDAMVGTPTTEGFISEVSTHMKKTDKRLSRFDKKIEEEVDPVLSYVKNWKFLLGVILGFTGFISAVAYIIYIIVITIKASGG